MSLYISESKIIGQGLYSDRSHRKGERVGIIHGPIEVVHKFTGKLITESLNWIGVGRYSWINTDKSLFRYINHSCEPNVYIKGKRIVVALHDISSGDELTMDYSLTEPDPEYVMPGRCRCKSKGCRKVISAISSLNDEQYRRKKRYISETFKRIFEIDRRKKYKHRLTKSL